MVNYQTTITKDVTNKKLNINREFDAPLETVWQAYTDSKILDQWWAPKPWKAETKSMDFRVGGHWLYAMVGPEGERHWARADFKSIDKPNKFEVSDAFCDENGNINPDLPSTAWLVTFTKTNDGTSVSMQLSFANEADMNKLVEMGFEQGMAAALENLVEVLKAK